MLKNLTPHPVVLRINNEDKVFPASGIVPRCSSVETPAEPIEGLPTVTRQLGAVSGLPAPEEGVWLIVGAMVLDACPDRQDLIAPDTGATAVRENGQVRAVVRFVRR